MGLILVASEFYECTDISSSPIQVSTFVQDAIVESGPSGDQNQPRKIRVLAIR